MTSTSASMQSSSAPSSPNQLSTAEALKGCPYQNNKSNTAPNKDEPSCPISHGERDRLKCEYSDQSKTAHSSIAAQPLSYLHPSNDQTGNVVTLAGSSAPGSALLPDIRQVSSIPRTPQSNSDTTEQMVTSNGNSEGTHHTSSAQTEYWVYPSQKQFYSSMKRKNFDPSEDDMAAVVSIHNVVNEMTWKKILSWEQKYKESCGRVTLKRFGGKPDQLSPKARLYSFFGYELPFDRHDWVVDRCGEEVTYVIDYYTGSSQQSRQLGNSLMSMFIDVRPALNSFQNLYDRVERFFSS